MSVSQDGAMDEHYSLIVDHISMIQSQQQGQNILASQAAKTDASEMEEWSSDEEEDGREDGDHMDI